MAGPKKHCRLTKADRHAMQAALDTRGPCRPIAEGLGRSPSTAFCEAKRNRVAKRGPDKGEKAADVPEDACPKLPSWPYACNGCRLRSCHCPKRWQAGYRAARAQALADEELSASRRGTGKTREQFERIMGCVKEGLARGLSPEQIVASYGLGVSPATICRWMEEGYAGTGSIELRREVSCRPRKKRAAPRSTSHGAERSHAAFLGLGEEERSSACEMDTAIGRVHGSKRLLTLYLRPCRFQLMPLLGGKTAEEAAGALDALEEAVGMDGSGRLFDPIPTDDGAELSDHGLMERPAGDSAARRARVFCCDARQSRQKGSCERSHVELRKALPKGAGFDGFTRAGCALLMSHANSEPRPSLAGLSPIRMFRLAYGELAERLLDALGIEEMGPGELSLTPSLLAHEEGRGMAIQADSAPEKGPQPDLSDES